MFNPPLQSHTITHGLLIFIGIRVPQAVCQAAQANRTSQSLSKSVSFPKHTDDKKKARLHNSVYVAIAGEVVNRRSVLLKNFVLNGQVSASNPPQSYTQNVSTH